MTSIQMPQLGETIVEGAILKWLKQEGEQIEIDEPPSSCRRTRSTPRYVARLGHGDQDPRGRRHDGRGRDGARGGRRRRGRCAPPPGPRAADPSAAAQEPVAADAVGAAAPGQPLPPPLRRARRTPPAPVASALPDRGPRSRRLSLVRKLAEEHQLELSQIAGSGAGERITKKDVMDAVAAGGTTAPAAAAASAPAAGAAPRCARSPCHSWPVAAKRSSR